MRAEPLEERRKCPARLLRGKSKLLRDGIQLSEALTGDGAAIFKHACAMGLDGVVKPDVRCTRGRARASWGFRKLIRMINFKAFSPVRRAIDKMTIRLTGVS